MQKQLLPYNQARGYLTVLNGCGIRVFLLFLSNYLYFINFVEFRKLENTKLYARDVHSTKFTRFNE